MGSTSGRPAPQRPDAFEHLAAKSAPRQDDRQANRAAKTVSGPSECVKVVLLVRTDQRPSRRLAVASPRWETPRTRLFAGMRFAMRFWLAVGAAIAAAFCYAAPATADTASFEDNVFRYRAGPDTFTLSLDLHLVPQGADHPTQLEARADVAAVTTEPGCNAVLVAPVSMLFEPSTRVVCPLPGPVGGRRVVRYRLSLTQSSDTVRVGGDLKGVAFAGRVTTKSSATGSTVGVARTSCRGAESSGGAGTTT